MLERLRTEGPPYPFPNGTERALMIFSGACLLIIWLFCNLVLGPADDVLVWNRNWNRIEDGLVPYLDFSFAYPPLALALEAIPGILTESEEGFYAIFSAQMLLFAWASVWLVAKVADKLGQSGFRTGALYFIVLLFYSTELTKKMDIVPAVTVLLALYYYLSARDLPAYAVLLIGGLIKIYPLLLAPVFIIDAFARKSSERRTGAVKGVAMILIVFAAAVVGLLAAGFSLSETADVFLHQSGRNFQIESVPGNLFLILGMLGLGGYEIVSHAHTYNVESDIADLCDGWWLWLSAALVIVSYIVFWHYRRKASPEEAENALVKGMVLSVLTLLLTFMVFSTQYMLWIVTLLPLMIMAEQDGRTRLTMQALFLLLFPVLLPQMIWYLFDWGEALGAVSVLIRNLLLLWFLAYALRGLQGRPLRVAPLRH